jgi:hypothetical protein
MLLFGKGADGIAVSGAKLPCAFLWRDEDQLLDFPARV